MSCHVSASVVPQKTAAIILTLSFVLWAFFFFLGYTSCFWEIQYYIHIVWNSCHIFLMDPHSVVIFFEFCSRLVCVKFSTNAQIVSLS